MSRKLSRVWRILSVRDKKTVAMATVVRPTAIPLGCHSVGLPFRWVAIPLGCHSVGLPFRWVNVMDIARRKSAINPCSWPPNGIGLVAARLTSGDHLRRYIEYPEDLRVAAGPFLQERSSMARALVSGTRGSSPPTPAKFRAAKRPAMVSAVVRSLAPASVIAGRVLGFGSPHLKQGAVSWATM